MNNKTNFRTRPCEYEPTLSNDAYIRKYLNQIRSEDLNNLNFDVYMDIVDEIHYIHSLITQNQPLN